jgi:polyisoprenoid-binding protein YceI
MRCTKLLVFILLVLILARAKSWADTYQIDSSNSTVSFTVRHMMISKVTGVFTDFSGTIQYDPQDMTKSSANGTIKTASVNTHNADRDEDLKSGEGFFEVAKFPDITFVSKRVIKKGSGFICLGTLTIHGVSRDVELPFTVTGPIKGMGGVPRIAVEASTTINRRDFGLTWSRMLDGGGMLVSDEVLITINAEAERKTASY